MVNEHDRLLPIANIGRIMKRILPPSAKISKEAKETMQECASEFISFVTGEASDKCHKENRKTVNGDDICWALSSLGLDYYVEAMETYLHKYRESERERAQRNKGSSSSTEGRDNDEGSSHNKGHQADDDEKQTETPTPTLEFRLLETGKSSLTKPS